MKFGVADYGMNVWYGGLYDIEERLENLKTLGFNGTERLEAATEADAIHKAALYRKLGMDFTTCRGPNVQTNIQWTAALGKKYVWMTPGQVDRNVDFEVFCRCSRALAKSCARWGITASIHNHMHQRVENQQELEDFLKAVPEAGIVFDTGHLSMAGGDPVEIVRKYYKRISVMHLKDVFLTGKTRDDGIKDYKFCELGGGNNGFSNAPVIEALLEVGWDGWIHIEHDRHERDPLVDLKTSIEFVKNITG
ncbi:MAG: sugar phosphate isomerase/epimerase family protein [Victivallaceae bacterium]